MNKQFIYAIILAMSLSLLATSCNKDDDDNAKIDNTEQTGNDQNPTDDVKLVSELKCTVAEFDQKYTTLKKGELVKVTLTDVSNSNIAKVSQVLKKMSSSSTLQKAGEESTYIIALYLQSADEDAITEIPAETFKGCSVIKAIEIPESVTKILADAFVGCVALETVKLPENVEITEGAFDGSVWQPEKKEIEKIAFPAPEYINFKSIDYATWTTYEFSNNGSIKTWAAKGEGNGQTLNFVWNGKTLLLDEEKKDNYYSGFKFDLNDNGLITKIIQTEIDEGEENTYQWILEYNSNNQLVHAAMTSTEVDYYSEWTYTYSEDGVLTECKNKYNYGNGESVNTYKYTYEQEIKNVHGQYWLDIPTPLDYVINEWDVFALVGYFGKASSKLPTGYTKKEVSENYGESNSSKNLSFEINADGYIVSEITGRAYTVKYNY